MSKVFDIKHSWDRIDWIWLALNMSRDSSTDSRLMYLMRSENIYQISLLPIIFITCSIIQVYANMTYTTGSK